MDALKQFAHVNLQGTSQLHYIFHPDFAFPALPRFGLDVAISTNPLKQFFRGDLERPCDLPDIPERDVLASPCGSIPKQFRRKLGGALYQVAY